MFLASKVFGLSLMASLGGAVTLVIANPIVALGDQSVRLSWEDFAKDPQKVASLRKAVAVMKARSAADHSSADYRKSWEYWANIHGYFGPQSPFGTVASNRNRVAANNQHYFDGILDMTPPDQVASDVWANCQHSTLQNSAPWFFAWHRLFLLYFEKQLQDAASDATLRYPIGIIRTRQKSKCRMLLLSQPIPIRRGWSNQTRFTNLVAPRRGNTVRHRSMPIRQTSI